MPTTLFITFDFKLLLATIGYCIIIGYNKNSIQFNEPSFLIPYIHNTTIVYSIFLVTIFMFLDSIQDFIILSTYRR